MLLVVKHRHYCSPFYPFWRVNFGASNNYLYPNRMAAFKPFDASSYMQCSHDDDVSDMFFMLQAEIL